MIQRTRHERPPHGRRPGQSDQLVCLAGKVEILFGKATCIVGYQGQTDLVVADIYIGMMLGFLGKVSDLVDEAKRGASGGRRLTQPGAPDRCRRSRLVAPADC